jgi:hypothetical protein
MTASRRTALRCALPLVCLVLSAWAAAAQPIGPPADPIGPSPTLGLAPPEGAVVLDTMDAFTYRDGNPATWKVEDGELTPTGGDIVSKEMFEDAVVHVEFRVPDMPDAHGQGRGNSGVGLQARYEVQVLDTYGVEHPGTGDCAGIYGQYGALMNACRPPLEWQTYDIIFRSARLNDAGEVAENARVTVIQNGRVVQNNVEIHGATGIQMDDTQGTPGPLFLQNHGCDVHFRNVWFVPLPAAGNTEYAGQ